MSNISSLLIIMAYLLISVWMFTGYLFEVIVILLLMGLTYDKIEFKFNRRKSE